MTVSVLVLTLNEESNLGACLDSVAWSDDIVVLDSLSSDQTTQIARDRGARIFEREFDNWSAHQNWAVANVDFRHPWVLYLDADERCEEALAKEILRRALPDASEAAFRIRRKDFFMGRWLRHAQIYPTWIVRVFRPKLIRYERLVNPVAVVSGSVGEMENHIIHFPFSHGIAHWIDRHNRYSDLEAIEAEKVLGQHPQLGAWRTGDPAARRRALKALSVRLPARPIVKFVYLYILRRGFLDGRAGFTYSVLQGFYEFLIVAKQREAKQLEMGPPR